MSRVACIALVTVVIGCSDSDTVTVDELCEDLDDECPKYYYFPLDRQECIEDGERMQSDAANRGCADKFDSHVLCVDEAGCQWMTSCRATRERLDACIINGH